MHALAVDRDRARPRRVLDLRRRGRAVLFRLPLRWLARRPAALRRARRRLARLCADRDARRGPGAARRRRAGRATAGAAAARLALVAMEDSHKPACRTALAAALVFAAGIALACAATDGFQAFTLESARRLHALTARAPVPDLALALA